MIQSHTFNALKWITDILNTHKARYRISGGFAAYLHGANRELADIDIDLIRWEFETIVSAIPSHYFVYGPARYKDEHWDCWLATLEYEGQKIDLMSVTDAKIFDAINNVWVLYGLLATEPWGTWSVEGLHDRILCRAIAKEDLIKYKNILRREVDLQDLKELKWILE